MFFSFFFLVMYFALLLRRLHWRARSLGGATPTQCREDSSWRLPHTAVARGKTWCMQGESIAAFFFLKSREQINWPNTFLTDPLQGFNYFYSLSLSQKLEMEAPCKTSPPSSFEQNCEFILTLHFHASILDYCVSTAQEFIISTSLTPCSTSMRVYWLSHHIA